MKSFQFDNLPSNSGYALTLILTANFPVFWRIGVAVVLVLLLLVSEVEVADVLAVAVVVPGILAEFADDEDADTDGLILSWFI